MIRFPLITSPDMCGYIEVPDNLSEADIELMWEQLDLIMKLERLRSRPARHIPPPWSR